MRTEAQEPDDHYEDPFQSRNYGPRSPGTALCQGQGQVLVDEASPKSRDSFDG